MKEFNKIIIDGKALSIGREHLVKTVLSNFSVKILTSKNEIKMEFGEVHYLNMKFKLYAVFYPEDVPVKERYLNDVVMESSNFTRSKYDQLVKHLVEDIGDKSSDLDFNNITTDIWQFDDSVITLIYNKIHNSILIKLLIN